MYLPYVFVLYRASSWFVVIFTSTNEVQHVPQSWIISNEVCWFPYVQLDNKDRYFTSAQIEKLIKQQSEINEHDGTNHNIMKVAGPFGKLA